jgi:hypothetical protein
MEAAASVRAAVSTAVILLNFSNMTRLPRFLFGCPRTQTSNEAQVGNLEESIHPLELYLAIW